MGFEAVFAIGLHDFCVARAKKVKAAADGTSMDRLPIPVEDKNGFVERATHRLFVGIIRKLAKTAMHGNREKAAVSCSFAYSIQR